MKTEQGEKMTKKAIPQNSLWLPAVTDLQKKKKIYINAKEKK